MWRVNLPNDWKLIIQLFGNSGLWITTNSKVSFGLGDLSPTYKRFLFLTSAFLGNVANAFELYTLSDAIAGDHLFVCYSSFSIYLDEKLTCQCPKYVLLKVYG